MKRKFNVFKFDTFIKAIESGLNVSEACNELNYNRSRMHDNLTEEQKTEIRAKRNIKRKCYHRLKSEIVQELKLPYKSNEGFSNWLNFGGELENTQQNVVTLTFLRLKFIPDGDKITVYSQIIN